MLGWVLGAIAATYICSTVNERDHYKECCKKLACENQLLRLTINNHRKLLSGYDYINKYAKEIGFKGAVAFFYYLAEEHDNRFIHFAKFLNKVRHVRNDVAHNGNIYDIDQKFIDKIAVCVEICKAFKRLPANRRLCLN